MVIHLSWLNALTPNLNSLASIVTIAGFCVTVWTLVKVSSVSRAQKTERKFIRDLVGFNNIIQIMSAASRKLDQEGSKESNRISDELKDMTGRIAGVTDVLYRSDANVMLDQVPISKGYFSDKFLENCIDQASEEVTILTYRALFLVNSFGIEKIREICQKGVKVRVLSFSSASSTEALESAMNYITIRPMPSSAEMFKGQLQHAEQYALDTITRQWSKEALENFEYRTYRTPPTIHFVRVDKKLHVGFVGLHNDCYPEKLAERTYVSLNINTPTSQSYLKHFDHLWSSAISII